MEVYWKSSWLVLLLGITLLATTLQGVQGEAETEGPSESECRPFIEKALKKLETVEGEEEIHSDSGTSKEDFPTVEISNDSGQQTSDGDDDKDDSPEKIEIESESQAPSESETEAAANANIKEEDTVSQDSNQEDTNQSQESIELKHEDQLDDTQKSIEESVEETKDDSQTNEVEDAKNETTQSEETQDINQPSIEEQSIENKTDEPSQESVEDNKTTEDVTSKENSEINEYKTESSVESQEQQKESLEEPEETANKDDSTAEDTKEESKEDVNVSKEFKEEQSKEEVNKSVQDAKSVEDSKSAEDVKSVEEANSAESVQTNTSDTSNTDSNEENKTVEKSTEEETTDNGSEQDSTSAPEEELTLETDIPDELRPRDHVEQLLKLDQKSSKTEQVINKVSEITLRELKKLYENAIKPLEIVYKYRDLSNRHFGDAEIFSKPLILFMGPWSGGKSSIINYLIDNEYNETSLRTGAEPSPAYFNILMHGSEPEIVDGTQLAADFTFSGLQKFGQGLEERLRGVKLPSKLLEKVNIVEIPGILEVRKQVSRMFPFNDACQWFIDRADIIFLVYDPSKLDVGPETEAILDQLKGREHQTRIVLNKADQVKPEELMRVQGALIWNISPLMSSAQPPIMYTTSLWSRPYEIWAPVRLLQAQERAFLRDMKSAIDKRIENKIASARRFAVRVRNHAKMVDCYLTTYYNHKSVFGSRKQVADQIVDHPQDYHIYEGLSTLTNISRYDLPDPDVYKDFFRLNALYDFQQLSATCTYFRGCPINRLDVAIAYDLPELVGKHRRLVESALAEVDQSEEKVSGS